MNLLTEKDTHTYTHNWEIAFGNRYVQSKFMLLIDKINAKGREGVIKRERENVRKREVFTFICILIYYI